MITGAPGRRILRTLLYMLNVSAFSSMAILSWLRYNNLFRRNTYRNIVAQIIFTGIDALPTITLLGLAAGFVFTFRLISIIVSLGATEELVSLLVNVICLGIGPFVAAIILINRIVVVNSNLFALFRADVNTPRTENRLAPGDSQPRNSRWFPSNTAET